MSVPYEVVDRGRASAIRALSTSERVGKWRAAFDAMLAGEMVLIALPGHRVNGTLEPSA